jgi:hypothetical protein
MRPKAVTVDERDGCETIGMAGETTVLDDLEYDDSESPTIGLAPVGVPWEDIQAHIRIAHQPLVLLPKAGAEYVGVYWTGTAIAVVEDLGSDHDQAISDFRTSLRERGEA